MGSVRGTVPTARGTITPGGTRDTLQQMAVRRSNRKASPAARAIERAGTFGNPYLTQPTLEQSRKKKKATKKKKKKQSEIDQLITKIKKYGIKN
mgnify:FL=1